MELSPCQDKGILLNELIKLSYRRLTSTLELIVMVRFHYVSKWSPRGDQMYICVSRHLMII